MIQTKPGITMLKGDATRPIGQGMRVICQVCNDVGAYGAGFSGAVQRRWPQVEPAYRTFYRNGNARQGVVLWLFLEPDLWLACMIAQRGLIGPNNPTPIDYDSLAKCLGSVNRNAVQIKATGVHMPKIGAGLAGGNWDFIRDIIEVEVCELPVYVYKP